MDFLHCLQIIWENQNGSVIPCFLLPISILPNFYLGTGDFITIILADNVGAWSIILGWIVGFVFHVSHQNGMALMEPFQEVPSGMPLNQIARVIEINLLQMLGRRIYQSQ